MSEQDFGSIPPGPANPTASPGSEPAWEAVPPPPIDPAPGYASGYAQQPPPASGYVPPAPGYQQYAPPPGGYAAPPGAAGLSDNAAGALAYVTIIPAIVFLLLAPYNQKPFVRFHAIQELGLFVIAVCLHLVLVVPILGFLVYIVGWVCLLVVWVICIVKASQGGAFKLPLIGDFAAQQSGYKI